MSTARFGVAAPPRHAPQQQLPPTVPPPGRAGRSSGVLARASSVPCASQPPPRTRRPREDEPTATIAIGDTGEHVAKPPRRDRGTLVALSGCDAGAAYAVERELVLGRSAEANVSIDDSGMSRHHARVLRAAEGFFVEDLGSTNGTFVNGARLQRRALLADGDRISVGLSAVFQFALQDEIEQDAVQRLYESAVRDPLTGLFNRRHLDERLRAEHAFAARHATDLSVMLVDIDHFKRVNDTYGHPAGDGVLRTVSATLARMLRGEDLVARYGGEEICIVARAIDARNAAIVAERCRRQIASLELPWEGQRISLTVSIGVATMGVARPFPDAAALVAAADRALYAAKTSGRDRVCAG
jgi:two-component system cell cycle response regulator